MEELVQNLLDRPLKAEQMAVQGYKTIMDRHTCSHRVDQLLEICGELGIDSGETEIVKIRGKG